MRRALLSLSAITAVSLAPSESSANERRFSYTYGSDVLPPGAIEVEPWTTLRLGRAEFYNRFDHRIELEIGLTDQLQTAFYLNFASITAGPARTTEFEWGGISSEWKYKLMDAVADPIGLALYFEPALAPNEAELEWKLILDKRVGDLYLAFNVVAELEFDFAPTGVEFPFLLQFDAGIAYFLSHQLSIGLELRSQNDFEPDSDAVSALFAGPSICWAERSWWATLTLLPQIAGLAGATPNYPLALDTHERVEARILIGVHL